MAKFVYRLRYFNTTANKDCEIEIPANSFTEAKKTAKDVLEGVQHEGAHLCQMLCDNLDGII